ncbi:pathogen-associated molecular patterns-induced protein A70-like [Ipomoea triloba]|uniref:pathogen-associated molecular patterns-induced protein A70-like n=1 Tax=Ipomoea triloba TaxID=35885 RepID=UPI00125CEBCE|nr:pathogen-associated molecular patterns-induced protein A70-like [Ipomoea triloba]
MLEDTVSIVPSSFMAAMNNWFTPTVFFVLLNVVIATIVFISSLANQKKQQQTPKLAGSPSVLQRLRSINLSNLRSQEPIFKFNPTDSDTLFNLDPTLPPQILEPQMPYTFFHLPQEIPTLETQTTHYIFRQENETHYVSHQETVERTETHDVKTEEIEAHFDFQASHEEEPEGEKEEEKPERLDEAPEPETTPFAVEIPERLPAKMKKSASMKSSAFKPAEKEDVEARRPATMKERVAAEVDEEVDAKADDFINKFRQQLKLQRVDSTLRYKEAIRRGAGS